MVSKGTFIQVQEEFLGRWKDILLKTRQQSCFYVYPKLLTSHLCYLWSFATKTTTKTGATTERLQLQTSSSRKLVCTLSQSLTDCVLCSL